MISGPPLNPDGATGHSLLREELSKPVYSPQRDWLSELEDWFYEHVLGPLLRNASTVPGALLTILVVALAVVVVIALLRFRTRRRQPARGGDEGVLGDSTLTAAQLRASAAAAAARGDNTAAYLDYFRAIARGGQERVVVSADPGATAHEIGEALGVPFPQERAGLRSAAASFDQFRYAEVLAAAADVAAVRDLEERIRVSRPVVVA